MGPHELAPELNKHVRALFLGGQPEVEPFLRETHQKCQEFRSFLESHAEDLRPSRVLDPYMVDIHHRHRVLEMLADRLGQTGGYRGERPSILRAMNELQTLHRDLWQARRHDRKASSGGKAAGGRTTTESKESGSRRNSGMRKGSLG